MLINSSDFTGKTIVLGAMERSGRRALAYRLIVYLTMQQIRRKYTELPILHVGYCSIETAHERLLTSAS